MQNVFNDEFIKIISYAMQGKQSNLEMKLRQLTRQIKGESPELASKLASLIKNSNQRGILRNNENYTQLIKPVDNDSRQELISEEYPVYLDEKPLWPDEINKSLNRFINQRNSAELLLDSGLLPSKSLLLTGPPGVGKTLGAQWLAEQLDLPLLTLDLATVMSSYLGKTGNNIRSVLNYAQKFPCVLLLDEFDSIAKKRDDDTDVGELKRLVTVLLQAIDNWPHTSVLVAATNHGELLDPAVWRRFDKVIDFENPTEDLIKEFLVRFKLDKNIADLIAPYFINMSFAIIERVINQAKINSLLEGLTLSSAIFDELGFDKNNKEIIFELAVNGLSQRKTADELGITRYKVQKQLNEGV